MFVKSCDAAADRHYSMLDFCKCSWVLAGLFLQQWLDASTTFKGKTIVMFNIFFERQNLNQSVDMPQAV